MTNRKPQTPTKGKTPPPAPEVVIEIEGVPELDLAQFSTLRVTTVTRREVFEAQR